MDDGCLGHALSAAWYAVSRNAPQLASRGVYKTDATLRQHVLAIADMTGLGVGGCGGQSHPLEIIQSTDAGVVFADAGIVRITPRRPHFAACQALYSPP